VDWNEIQSVVGSVESLISVREDATLEYRLSHSDLLTAHRSVGHQQAGSLAGAAHSRNNIWSNQRSAQAGQESAVEFKSKSWPDWILSTKES
jgi:hypothetical protein